MSIPFWSNDPYILFNKDHLFELWPLSDMSYEQKLNSVTRLILLISIAGYILTMSIRILVVGLLTLLGIYLLYRFHTEKNSNNTNANANANNSNNTNNVEGFEVEGDHVYGLQSLNPTNKIKDSVGIDSVLQSEFKEGNRKNPFSNVLLTQINDEPNRKAAPPAFNPNVEEKITDDVKKAVQFVNPEIDNTNKQLFGSLWSKFDLDNSNRSFYSTPNTRVTNDQTAYAKYLYGDMPSAKGSTMEDNIQREKDNYRYTLY